MGYVIFGNFRWMALLGILIGLTGGYVFWEENVRAQRVGAEGIETTAHIINLRQQIDSKHRKTYWADIKWRDQTGAERQQTRIMISGTYARRVSKDGRRVVREARIKYMPDEPNIIPLILDDVARNSYQLPAMMWLSLAFAILCAYGWYHMLSFERRADARKANPAAAG